MDTSAPQAVDRRPIEGSSLLRLPSVLRATGLGRSTLYRLIAACSFPAPVRLSKRAVAWRASEVEIWSQSRPTTRPADDRH